jgi:hypothetical protein
VVFAMAQAAPGVQSWVHQIAKECETTYNIIKADGIDHGFLTLDKQKLYVNFFENYSQSRAELLISMKDPDRHKEIALLTRAFLDAAPFACNKKQMLEKSKEGENIYRRALYPNEVFAVHICELILSAYCQSLPPDDCFDFRFPSNIYIRTQREADSNYEYELFVLYRHYLSRKREGKAQFSIYQMSHLYFLLEMAAEISHKKDATMYFK